MKTSFRSLFVAVLTAVACMLPAAGQTSNQAVNNIVATQDLLASTMLESLTAARTNGTSPRMAAQTVQSYAEALCKLQHAERAAYELANAREQAPQTMTSALAKKALDEAKALGVSGKVRSHLMTEWSTAATTQGALDAIGKMASQSDLRIQTAAQSGGFFRAMPSWMGGTTSYANYRGPRMATDDDSRIARIEKALGMLSTVTTVTK